MSVETPDRDESAVRVDRGISLLFEGVLIALVASAFISPAAVAWVIGFAAIVGAAAVVAR